MVVSKNEYPENEDPKTHYENEDPLRKRRPIPLFFNQTEAKNRERNITQEPREGWADGALGPPPPPLFGPLKN